MPSPHRKLPCAARRALATRRNGRGRAGTSCASFDGQRRPPVLLWIGEVIAGIGECRCIVARTCCV